MNHATDSCAAIDELLLDFAYGELAAAERRSVEGHLSGCERCRTELDAMMGTRRMMQALQPEPVPAGGVESLLAYAQQATVRQNATPSRRWWSAWLLPALPVGGLLVALLTVVTRQADPAAMLLASEKQPSAVEERAEPAGERIEPPKQVAAAAPAEPLLQAAAEREAGLGRSDEGRFAKGEQAAPAKADLALDEGGGGGDFGTLLEQRRKQRAATRTRAAAKEAKDAPSGPGTVATSVAQPAAAGFAPPAAPSPEPAPRPLRGARLTDAAEAAKAKRAEVWAAEPAGTAGAGAGASAATSAVSDDLQRDTVMPPPPARRAPAARAPVATTEADLRQRADSEERAEMESERAASREMSEKREVSEKKVASTGRIAPGHTFLLQLAAARAASERGEYLGAVEHAVRALASATSDDERRSARTLIADEARRFLSAHPDHARAAEVRSARATALEGLGRYSEARAEWAALEAERTEAKGSAKPASAPAASEPASAPGEREAVDALSR